MLLIIILSVKSILAEAEEYLFTEREKFSTLQMYFLDITKSEYRFRAGLFDKAISKFIHFPAIKMPAGGEYHQAEILPRGLKNLELVVYCNGVEQRIPLKEGTYPLMTNSNGSLKYFSTWTGVNSVVNRIKDNNICMFLIAFQ